MWTDNDENNGDARHKYSIDIGWSREPERSFALLAVSRMCPSSQKKKIPKTETAILNALKQCCAKSESFITPDLPLAETIFRLFLANGNKPLSLERIQAELQQRLSEISGSRDLSIPKLKRILDSDRFYGMKPTEADEEEEEELNNSLPQND